MSEEGLISSGEDRALSKEAFAASFYTACLNNDLEIVQLIVEKVFCQTFHDGFVPACRFNHVSIVSFLLSTLDPVLSIMNPTNDHYTINQGFFVACVFGHLDIIKMLFPHVTRKNCVFGFFLASTKANMRANSGCVLAYFISQGIDPHFFSYSEDQLCSLLNCGVNPNLFSNTIVDNEETKQYPKENALIFTYCPVSWKRDTDYYERNFFIPWQAVARKKGQFILTPSEALVENCNTYCKVKQKKQDICKLVEEILTEHLCPDILRYVLEPLICYPNVETK
jgi:hypothetical protein